VLGGRSDSGLAAEWGHTMACMRLSLLPCWRFFVHILSWIAPRAYRVCHL
jgi:hypothetical protein